MSVFSHGGADEEDRVSAGDEHRQGSTDKCREFAAARGKCDKVGCEIKTPVSADGTIGRSTLGEGD